MIPALDHQLSAIDSKRSLVRYPRAQALAVAREMVAALSPVVERLVVAGSLRRLKPDVGDVEIVYIPRLKPIISLRQQDWLSLAAPEHPGEGGSFSSSSSSSVPVFQNLADLELESFVRRAVILQRKTSIDSITWGEKNKFAVHVSTGIPVDFFAATADNWWNYVVCRTGPADNNTRICMAAQDRGYKWNPYGPGFTRLRDGRILRVRSERAVYAIAGLPYREPKDR